VVIGFYKLLNRDQPTSKTNLSKIARLTTILADDILYLSVRPNERRRTRPKNPKVAGTKIPSTITLTCDEANNISERSAEDVSTNNSVACVEPTLLLLRFLALKEEFKKSITSGKILESGIRGEDAHEFLKLLQNSLPQEEEVEPTKRKIVKTQVNNVKNQLAVPSKQEYPQKKSPYCNTVVFRNGKMASSTDVDNVSRSLQLTRNQLELDHKNDKRSLSKCTPT
jgi:hypothetical protein